MSDRVKPVYQRTVEALLRDFSTDAGGLSATEAELRQQQYGLNQLETKSGINPLMVFLDQFKSFIIYILLFAIFFSLLIGEYVDSVIILLILLANALIGFFQELSAHKSLEALKRISIAQARVLRDGIRKTIEAKDLVPGDIVLLEAGDKVPADCRLIAAVQLRVEESALTGESLPVDKSIEVLDGDVPIGDRRNMLFSATTLATGNARALVVATGMSTELGRITSLLKETKEEATPLQRRLDIFGKKLASTIIGICLVIFIIFLSKAYFAETLSVEVLVALTIIAISLAVAAVPEALPAVVTIALSVGVKRLLSRQALVRRLSSVETLGSCDVICTDKTGTLTENRMMVRYAWTADGETILNGSGYAFDGEIEGSDASDLFRCGLLCNNASIYEEAGDWRVAGDPTEAALLTSAARAGVSSDAERLGEIPFNSERKMMSVLVSEQGHEVVYSKGALGSILDSCRMIMVDQEAVPLTAALRRTIEEQNRHYAGMAMRVLAFAFRKLDSEEEFSEDDLVFLGLQAMIDPPRPDVIESIARTQKAGIRVIMITGDYGETASAIGREIGLSGESLSGQEIERMDIDELKLALNRNATIISRVAPEHKQRIVQALQESGNVVAMTGDGVNDAPALKKADIGVAVGSGTEVAKDASDFILLDDSFTHIVNAIEEGRGIYDNIQKSIMLLLSGNLGEVLIIFLAALFGMNLPLTAILLLWINLVTDGAPALAYSVDPYGTDIMHRLPKPHAEGILPLPKLLLLGVFGLLSAVLALTLFYFSGGTSNSPAQLVYAQTMVFNFVVLYQIVLTFFIRWSYRVPLFCNRWVWGAALLALLLQGGLMYTDLSSVFKIVPLAGVDLMQVFAAAVVFLVCGIIVQVVFDRKRRGLAFNQ